MYINFFCTFMGAHNWRQAHLLPGWYQETSIQLGYFQGRTRPCLICKPYQGAKKKFSSKNITCNFVEKKKVILEDKRQYGIISTVTVVQIYLPFFCVQNKTRVSSILCTHKQVTLFTNFGGGAIFYAKENFTINISTMIYHWLIFQDLSWIIHNFGLCHVEILYNLALSVHMTSKSRSAFCLSLAFWKIHKRSTQCINRIWVYRSINTF